MTSTVFLSPVYGAGGQVFSNSGVPLGGGKIYTYYSGTTVPAVTFSDPAGSVANPNPIILDSGGRLPTQVWLPTGSIFRFSVTDSAGNTVGYTVDGVQGIGDTGGAAVAGSEWNQLPNGAAFVNVTTFTFFGDYTTYFTTGRQVRVLLGSGYVYSWVASCTFNAGTGYSTVVLKDGVLDSTMSLVYIGFINSTPNSLPQSVITMSPIGLSGSNLIAGSPLNSYTFAGSYNVGFGVGAVGITTGGFNTGVGWNTLVGVNAGSYNTGIGANAGSSNTGSNSTAAGYNALYYAVSSQSVAVGSGAGYNSSLAALATLTNSIYIGYSAKNASTSEINAIVIGANVTSNGSNTITIGNSSHTDLYLFGRVRIPQYTTAGAPAYVKGALYFDTTLNKLRVGGASGWETITST